MAVDARLPRADPGPRPDDGGRLPTDERLLDAAERLVALHGSDGVSDRRIIAVAGQRNKSVIAYHFGTRQMLLDAVWRRRTARVNAVRSEHLARITRAGRRAERRALVEVYLYPLVEEIGALPVSYWARFNERRLAELPTDVLAAVDAGLQPYARPQPLDVLLDVARELVALHGPDHAGGTRRVSVMMRMCVAALAAWERDAEAAPSARDHLGELAMDLVDMAVAMLAAPATGAAATA